MGKVYKKKTSRKKPTCGGKKKRFSRRKMKGGVAFNTSFSTSSLPSSTYIPLNPNVNDNPSWNQYAGRLLPEVVMKGGKRTRKKRGGLLGRQILFDDFKRRNKRYIFNKFGYDTAGQKAEKAEKEEKEEEEKKEIRTHNKNIQTDLEENYVQVDGKFLYDAHIDNVKDIVFYEVGYNYGNDRAKIKELGTIVGKKSETYKDSGGSGNDYKLSFLKNNNINKETAYSDGDMAGYKPADFYFKNNGDNENALQRLYQESKKGGKKARKSRRKRKMKGGSLVGTDIVTGLNTTDTNAALAIGTTGGTNYMLDTITAKEVSTGDYMSPDLRPVPLV